ncbi:MAG TPA: hypothetical protein VF402_10975 [Asticcacaulis sp.]
MRDFLLLTHDDATEPATGEMWGAYFARLRTMGVFDGGSAIGRGEAFRKTGAPDAVSARLSGYIRVRAPSLSAARELLDGHPVYEAGGTVEIRELPKS